MEKKINIAKLLKDCPEGMELDCTMYENVYFDRVNNIGNIECYIKSKDGYLTRVAFYENGCSNTISNAKCVIFPKGKTTWEGFQRPFKDGDILISGLANCGYNPFIFKQTNGLGNAQCYCAINSFEQLILNSDNWTPIKGCRLATEGEKQKLFDAIKENGYKWNAEAKTLEKLTIPHTPEKFYIRIGDIPSNEKSKIYKGDSVIGEEDGVSVYNCIKLNNTYHIVMPLPLKEGQGMTYENLIQEITQCRYEIEKPRNVYLVSGMEIGKGHDNEPLIKNVKILKDLTGQFNTKNYSTEETKTLEKLPKFKVGDRIKHKDSDIYCNLGEYSDVISAYRTNIGLSLTNKDLEQWELVPNKFDITTLKPFDKVLVRQNTSGKWGIDFLGFYNEGYYHATGNCIYVQCIPYEGNEHLLGTTVNCDQYYKTWEE